MKNKTIKKVIGSLGKYKIALICAVLLSAICVFIGLYIPVLAGRAIDLIIYSDGEKRSYLLKIIAEIVILALSAAVLQWIANAVNNKIAFGAVRDLRNKAIEKICVLPVSSVDKMTAGDTVSRVISDADQLSDGLIMGFSQLFNGILTIVVTLVLMLKISAKITPAVVLLTPLSLLIAKFIAGRTHSMFKAQSEERGRQTHLIDEAVTNRKVITAYGAEKEFSDKFREINDSYADKSLKAVFYSSLTNPSTRFINNVIYAAVAFFGALLCLSGSMTVGGLTIFLSYSGQYAKPFNEISGVIAEFQNALACAERLFELIESRAEEPDKPNSIEIKSSRGNVEFSDVTFSYDKSSKLIESLNFSVKEGMQAAIVGPTGCGKTTVINLLMRFYDVDNGKISVDGNDTRDITRSSLRSVCGMMLQETWIKTATVRENIAIGKPGASLSEIISAAKTANADSFIRKLPKGYDTVISDDTGGLSQGQKQLLCLSRLFLCMPDIVILDEATSSIDTVTEIKIRSAVKSLTVGKTSFIVAHRLSTVKNSDLILVMKDGDVIEQGTHDELIAAKGFYSELYSSRVY